MPLLSFQNNDKIFCLFLQFLSPQFHPIYRRLKDHMRVDFFWDYCSDFRYDSNGIFVLGVGFFFRQISTL